jgi:hypothetical protein
VKLICSTIFIFCCSHFLLAQSIKNTIEYTWQSNDGKTAAQISIKPAQENASNKTIFYFIVMQDSINKNLVDTSSNNIFKALPPSCTAILIAVSQKLDSIEVRDFFALSKLLITEVLPFVHQKYGAAKNANTILAGLDAGAEIALISALSFPDKFNKTAFFFNDYLSGFAYINKFESPLGIKGKLFMYVNHKGGKLDTSDGLVYVLALKSSIMLYKIDAYEEDVISFEDGYKWLMADGNNYIIKTE